MSQYDELKRLATRIVEVQTSQDVPISKLFDDFEAAACPETILALIAENERLSGECEGCPMRVAEELRAENAGLRTGYQAYERVNAELKAENEALRKRIDDVSPFKGAPMTGPDTKCLACGGHHSGLGGLPCPKMSPVAQALSMENQRVTPVEPLRNEHDDAAEREAQKIYDSWAGNDGFVPWVKGGNSIKQDEARRMARAAMGKGEQS